MNRWLPYVMLVALLLTSCRDARECESNADCFQSERCDSGECLTLPKKGPVPDGAIPVEDERWLIEGIQTELDLDGYPHLAIADSSVDRVLHVYWDGTAWQTNTIVEDYSPDDFSEILMRSGPTGAMYLLYTDDDGKIWLHNNESGEWTGEVVYETPEGQVAFAPDMAVDFDSVAHICFTQGTAAEVTTDSDVPLFFLTDDDGWKAMNTGEVVLPICGITASNLTTFVNIYSSKFDADEDFVPNIQQTSVSVAPLGEFETTELKLEGELISPGSVAEGDDGPVVVHSRYDGVDDELFVSNRRSDGWTSWRVAATDTNRYFDRTRARAHAVPGLFEISASTVGVMGDEPLFKHIVLWDRRLSVEDIDPDEELDWFNVLVDVDGTRYLVFRSLLVGFAVSKI